MDHFWKKHWRGGGLKFSVTPLPCTILNGTALKNPVSFSFKSYLLFTSTLQYDLIVHNDEKSLQNILKCVEVCLHVKHMASINYRPMINHFCALNNVFSSSPHRKKVWKFILKKMSLFHLPEITRNPYCSEVFQNVNIYEYEYEYECMQIVNLFSCARQ